MGLTVTGVISWCVFGLIVGAVARLIMPGKQEMNLLLTMILGIIGSFVGGAIAAAVFGGSDSFVNPAGWIMSIVGALILLFGYTKLAKK